MRETASARRQAPRHVASILDSARKLGIRDAQVADIHHYREADDLRRTVEITEGIVHHRRL